MRDPLALDQSVQMIITLVYNLNRDVITEVMEPAEPAAQLTAQLCVW
ncbi:MAG TPA: hypothetical protein V6D03_09775 [Candidatus Caenarcaniphilales bacterium]